MEKFKNTHKPHLTEEESAGELGSPAEAVEGSPSGSGTRVEELELS